MKLSKFLASERDSSLVLLFRLVSVAFCAVLMDSTFAQAASSESSSGSEWYFSWGYNRDYWGNSDIHVSQPTLGNNFTVHNVQGQDFPQWTGPNFIFGEDVTIPQFDLHFGHFFNQEYDLAWEFSLDHTKYSSVPDQSALVTGTVGGSSINSYQVLSSNYFTYYLHNGANHIMLNLVKRSTILGQKNKSFSLAVLYKVGGGIMLPHSENVIMGNASNVGPKVLSNFVGYDTGWWQLNGWTVGAEIGLRFVLLKPLYIEFDDKEAYASLSHIPVYLGKADQNLWMNEWSFNLGLTIN